MIYCVKQILLFCGGNLPLLTETYARNVRKERGYAACFKNKCFCIIKLKDLINVTLELNGQARTSRAWK